MPWLLPATWAGISARSRYRATSPAPPLLSPPSAGQRGRDHSGCCGLCPLRGCAARDGSEHPRRAGNGGCPGGMRGMSSALPAATAAAEHHRGQAFLLPSLPSPPRAFRARSPPSSGGFAVRGCSRSPGPAGAAGSGAVLPARGSHPLQPDTADGRLFRESHNP